MSSDAVGWRADERQEEDERHPVAPPPLDRPVGAALGWHQLGSRHVFRSPWYDLRQDRLTLPDGSPAVFTFVEHPGFVTVVPVLADGRVVLIRSYRYTVDEHVMELPAGGFGVSRCDQAPADPVTVARHELLEEAGVEAERFEAVGRYWSGIGHSRCRAHVLLARGARRVAEPRPEATEHIDVVPTAIDVALEMARDGRIADGHSALALLLCEPQLRGVMHAL